MEIAAELLVRGDIVKIGLGDKVAAAKKKKIDAMSDIIFFGRHRSLPTSACSPSAV